MNYTDKITRIIVDMYKPNGTKNNVDVYDMSDSFNARVGDEQIPLMIEYRERGIIERMTSESLTPFAMGYVGQPDEHGKVTAETGVAVSYHGSSDDVIGAGKVKMDLPGAMFPQEGMFYGFFGLENSAGKRITSNDVCFEVKNGNPDMYVDSMPFRSELQKLLDWATAQADSEIGDIKTKWETLRDTITEMIKQGDTDLTSLKNRIGLAEDEVQKLLKLIDDKNLITQDVFDSEIKKFEEKLQIALNELQKPIPIDNTVIIGGPISSDEKNALDKLRSTVDTSKFNLLFLNDPHYGMQSDLTNYGPRYGINHLNTALYLDDLVNVIVSGGDNIDGHLDSYAGLMNDEQNYALELIYGSPNHADKFALRGNHDDGSERVRAYREQSRPFDALPATITRAQFNEHYQNGQLLFGEQRQDGGSYFYKDYPDFKVRLIGLDSNDTPEELKGSDGGVKYPGLNYMGYQQKQLDWLANIALQNVPEDYVTIILAHVQATPSKYDDDLTDPTQSHYTNQKQVNQIINDFKNGQSSVVTNNVKDWEINVKTNFVQQGQRDVAAWIHGHLHYEESTTSNGFNDVSCISSIPYTGYDKGSKNGGWSLFTLDSENRKLKITGYGMATNRSFSY
ncbi:metallophosphoesterase [Pediococcus acidilactici]|uniref:metallophosphoesterase n=1 Tax=Pediococcus acidilactici TaxID=1254 RepID=UPI002AFE9BD6|nr:metallophosphoesterase [Pediococcus acidilactici]WQS11949.1 metallophosphoesterase [Pediococcus acidilactici]